MSTLYIMGKLEYARGTCGGTDGGPVCVCVCVCLFSIRESIMKYGSFRANRDRNSRTVFVEQSVYL